MGASFKKPPTLLRSPASPAKRWLQTDAFAVFGAAGEAFDPALHNAVMHCEDEALGENVIAEVFQKGFTLGDKVVRFAMVKVAN